MFEMKKVSVPVIATLMGMGISGVASASDDDRGKVVTAGDQADTFKLPGSNTSLGFYGSVRFNAIHDFKQSSPNDYFNDTAAIAIREDNSNNVSSTDTRPAKTYLTARTSRIGFISATPTEWGKVSTKIEMDFASTIGSNNVASPSGNGTVYAGRTNGSLYLAQGKIDGKWGSVTMGQKWSAFGNLDAFPDEVDVNFVNSGVGVRQPGIQVDLPFTKSGALTLSIENAASLTDVASRSTSAYQPNVAPNMSSRPDFIAKWTTSGDWGSVAFSVLNTQFKYETANSSIERKKNATGYNVGANIKIGKNDSIQAQYTGGKGIDRYMVNTNYNFAVFDPSDNSIKPYESKSYLIGWGHTWTKTIRSSLAYGQTTITNHFPTVINRDNHHLKEAYADVWWAPIPKVEFGFEYNWGKRELYPDNVTGAVYSGQRSRVEFVSKYTF